MYAMVMMAVLAGPGQPCCGGFGYGYGHGYGAPFAHGYGYASPVVSGCCGVVLPPAWPVEPTPPAEEKAWMEYVMQLEGAEREDMMRVWQRGTPEARRKLLAKLPPLEAAAAAYREKVEKQRNAERAKVENRPLTDDEIQIFEDYLDTLKGAKRKEAEDRWKRLNNRDRRLWLKELQGKEKGKEEKEKEQTRGDARAPRLVSR